MTAREKILLAITKARPELKTMPVVSMNDVTVYDDVLQKFIETLQGIGGQTEEINDISELNIRIETERKSGMFVLNTVSESLSENQKAGIHESAMKLEPLYKAYIKASIGVAENGAVWINESQMINRLLPFICQHLVVVLEKEKLVSTMHHAYQKINTFEEGFGVFIAGPSKTADIEQSLVIGAHGARSMTVLLLN